MCVNDVYWVDFFLTHKQSYRRNAKHTVNEKDDNKRYASSISRSTNRAIIAIAADYPAVAGAPNNRGTWLEVGSKIECDTSAGEEYIENSPVKVTDIEQCKKSCENSVECQSITYRNTGWCSHFSTPCTHHKINNKAVSMRLDTNVASTSTPGRFRLVV